MQKASDRNDEPWSASELPNEPIFFLLPPGVRAWLDANINLTRVFLDIYPREEIVDIELYDTNGTKFAYYDPDRGATVNMSGVHDRPMPVFWNQLKVTDGSLLLTTIQ